MARVLVAFPQQAVWMSMAVSNVCQNFAIIKLFMFCNLNTDNIPMR